VQTLTKNNCIKGVAHFDNHAWMIPADADKTGDPRSEVKQPPKSLSADFIAISAATIAPMSKITPIQS